ncbi:MAG: hypothetical protein M1834_000478 [Cirrosporium novae-zelandiae]|nr:MAG: hypothetical protein M1834_000478 [Cirrosporium novae-zelandiae]
MADHLPGFGMPLNYLPTMPDNSPLVEPFDMFHHTLIDLYSARLRTVRERTMVALMNHLTDKPDWDRKIFEDAIVSKWKQESSSQTQDITDSMLSWCMAEVKDKAKVFQATGTIVALDEGVMKSDSLVSDVINASFKDAVKPLEQVGEKYLDWHPGSDRKVLDLVHPSLFCLIYGVSKILPSSTVGLEDCEKRCGEGVVLDLPREEDLIIHKINPWEDCPENKSWSKKFQWLPCEVKLDPKDGSAKIVSYINNLPPEGNETLYSLIEQVISSAIPLWNGSLMRTNRHSRRRIDDEECNWVYAEDYEELEPPDTDEEDSDDYWEHQRQHQRQNRILEVADCGEYISETERTYDTFRDDKTGLLKEEEIVDLRKDFGKEGLQVIVKLANIVLTPEKPEYGGGTWHIEGMLNEHICATALYYYDCSNITESRLAFRAKVNSDIAMSYEQDDHEGPERTYGFQNEEPAVIEIGDVLAREGRLVTFPNTLQHCVRPFKLADPTKPGHRKILALFLVDPHLRAISTANVPCQQKSSWEKHIRREGLLEKLPEELKQQVISDVEDFPISLEQAKRFREELMEERSRFVESQTNKYLNETFSLCEH